MASTPYIMFVLCLALIPYVRADDDCESYTDQSSIYHPEKKCNFLQYCCGSCDHRYCCSSVYFRLTEDEQHNCENSYSSGKDIVRVTASITGIVIMIIIIISCCVCPCCCLYKMCRKPTPVVATTTTVVQSQYTPQPNPAQAYQGAQYPGYQPVPVQPGYGAQPMPTAPYQGPAYGPGYQGPVSGPGYQGPVSGPPPPYQEAGPGYPPAPMAYSQAAYDGGHPAYPPQPPVQPAHAPPPPMHPDYTAQQPAYNPAYMEPPKTGN